MLASVFRPLLHPTTVCLSTANRMTISQSAVSLSRPLSSLVPSPSPLQRIFAGLVTAAAPQLPIGAAVAASRAGSAPCDALLPSASSTGELAPVLASLECVWCLLSRLHVVPLAPSVVSHLPPQWSAASDVKQWKRRIDMKRVGDDTDEHNPLNGPRCSYCSSRTHSLSKEQWQSAPHRAAGRPHVSPVSPPAQPASSASIGMDRVSVLHGFLSTRSIPSLLQQTNYSRHELYSIFLRFKSLCCLSGTGPDGIDAATFQRGVVRLSVEDERFVSRVFALVDADNSGSIEWEEFLVAMAALEKGSAEIKAKFACQVYDLDGDGFIGRQDLVRQHSEQPPASSTTS